MSALGTLREFGQGQLNSGKPADNRLPGANGDFLVDGRLDSEGPEARAVDPIRTEASVDRFDWRTALDSATLGSVNWLAISVEAPDAEGILSARGQRSRSL